MDPNLQATPGNRLHYAVTRRVPFPHMGPQDTKVWRFMLALGLVQADSFEYDVRLGGKGAVEIPEAHIHREMWATLLRKRVDVVAWRGQQPELIEVKPIASFAALGQCLGYGWLWSKEKGQGVKPALRVCCAVCDPDLKPVFASYGIAVSTLPPEEALAVLAPGPHRTEV